MSTDPTPQATPPAVNTGITVAGNFMTPRFTTGSYVWTAWGPIPTSQTQPPEPVGEDQAVEAPVVGIRTALAAEPVAAESAGDDYDREGEIAAVILDHSYVDPERNLSRVLRECDFGATARAILARWGRPTALAEPFPSHGEVCQWLERQGHWGDNAHRIPRIANMVQDALARWGRPAAPPAPEPSAEALAARAALKAEPASDWPTLQWTESMPPNNECHYDHCIAETPFGRFLITWKSWKDYDSPTVDETPWGDWYSAFNSVDEAKAACQQGMNERLAHWGRPAAPPAPEVGEFIQCLQIRAASLGAEGANLSQRGDAAYFTRAATLLQQLSAPAPVAVPVVAGEGLEVLSPEPAPAPAAAQSPLWWDMLHAYDNAPAPSRGAPDDWTDHQGYAAEIIAVRDRVVPEEAPPVAPTDSPAWLHWQQRQAIRALLTTEAARAEAGE
jgi:hypothetical protein